MVGGAECGHACRPALCFGMGNLWPDLGRRILTTVSDAIIAADRDGVIRFWNPGAERIFGYSASESEGQSLDLIVPERQRARH
jgi:PAS domain S-box-containing protein